MRMTKEEMLTIVAQHETLLCASVQSEIAQDYSDSHAELIDLSAIVMRNTVYDLSIKSDESIHCYCIEAYALTDEQNDIYYDMHNVQSTDFTKHEHLYSVHINETSVFNALIAEMFKRHFV